MHVKNGSKDLKIYPQINRRVRDTLARNFSARTVVPRVHFTGPYSSKTVQTDPVAAAAAQTIPAAWRVFADDHWTGLYGTGWGSQGDFTAFPLHFPLPYHCLATASPLPHHCLTTAFPLPKSDFPLMIVQSSPRQRAQSSARSCRLR